MTTASNKKDKAITSGRISNTPVEAFSKYPNIFYLININDYYLNQ